MWTQRPRSPAANPVATRAGCGNSRRAAEARPALLQRQSLRRGSRGRANSHRGRAHPSPALVSGSRSRGHGRHASARRRVGLVDQGRLPYLTANSTERRLINQAIFYRLIITSADDAEAEPAPLYDQLAQLARDLPAPANAHHNGRIRTQTAPNKTGEAPKTTTAPFLGAGVRTSSKWRRGRDSNPRWSLIPILA